MFPLIRPAGIIIFHGLPNVGIIRGSVLNRVNSDQGMGCDRFLGRTQAPRTSRFMCARTCVRTSNLRWSPIAPAPAPFISLHFFPQFFNNVLTIFKGSC